VKTNSPVISAEKQRNVGVNKKLKSLFITLPQRGAPADIPPYGVMSIITRLRKEGYQDTFFYHMDLERPLKDQMVEYVVTLKLDVLCISAPVSTSYDNCKFYSLEIKKQLPDITVIMGGNLAASAEVLLRKTGVDFCVLGEGEKACTKLFDTILKKGAKKDFYAIQGLAFLDGDKLINTGYAEQVPKEEIFKVDWDILTEMAVKKCFPKIKTLNKGTCKYFFRDFQNTIPESMEEKTSGHIFSSKGCVARCTFCHRFIKGIRFVPPEMMIARIEELIKRFDVGILSFDDECFGADIRWLRKFCELIKPLNLLWNVGGMRVKQVNPEIIAMLKDAGCRSIVYGMETGSERMIKIMEKRASVEDNIKAFQITLKAGLYTIPQLIIGMPGESPETIEESAEFIAKNMTLDQSQNPREVSINFAQALPGTPLYEYARNKGMIGKSLEAEEEYLLYISDRNSCDEETTLNFTEYSRLELLSWRNVILCIVKYKYVMKFGMEYYYKVMFEGNPRPGFISMLKDRNFGIMLDCYPRFSYRMRKWMWLLKLADIGKKKGARLSWTLLREFIFSKVHKLKKTLKWEYKSLRKIVEKDTPDAYKGTESMVSLRKGR